MVPCDVSVSVGDEVNWVQCDTCEQWFHMTSVCVSVGDEVNWVQCDTCEQWFHLLCVGLGEDEVAGNEEYQCFMCKNEGGATIKPSLSAPPVFGADTALVTDSEDDYEKAGEEMEEEEERDEGVGEGVSEEGVQGMTEGTEDSVTAASQMTADWQATD